MITNSMAKGMQRLLKQEHNITVGFYFEGEKLVMFELENKE